MNARTRWTLNLLTAASMVPFLGSAQSIWDGDTDGNWGTAANWVGDTLPPFGAGARIVFYAAGAKNLSTFLGGGRTIGSLQFDSNVTAPVTIRLTTTATGTTAAHLTFNNGSGINSTIAVASAVSANITIGAAGGNLNLNAPRLVIDHQGSALLNINRTLGISGNTTPVTITGGGTVRLLNTVTTGGITLDSGWLQINHNDTFGSSGSFTLTINGGRISAASTVSRTSAVNWVLGGNVAFGDTGDMVGTVRFTGPGTLTGSRVITVDSPVVLAGAIGDGGNNYSITKHGESLLRLSGANTYGGGTIIQTGVVAFTQKSAMPATGTVQVGPRGVASLGVDAGDTAYWSASDLDALWEDDLPGFALDFSSLIGVDVRDLTTFTYSTPQSTRGLVKTGRGTLVLNAANSYSQVVLFEGTLRQGVSGAIPNNGVVSFANRTNSDPADAVGILDMNNIATTLTGLQGYEGGRVTNANLTLNIGGTQVYYGRFDGPGSITKTGLGTWRLYGNSSIYEGSFTLQNGTIEIGHNNALGIRSNVVLYLDGGALVPVDASRDLYVDYVLRGNVTLGAPAHATNNLNLRLGSAGTFTLGGNYTITVPGAATALVYAAVTDGANSYGFTKAGSGMLRLQSDNDFDGEVVVQEGRLGILAPFALGGTNAGTVVRNGGSLRFQGVDLDLWEPLTLSGLGTASGANNGALVANRNSGIWNLYGPITLDGGARVTTYNANIATMIIHRAIGGTGDLRLQAGAANNGGGLFVLRGQSTYTGDTYIELSSATSVVVAIEVNQALPATTVLRMEAGSFGAGLSAISRVELRGWTQQVAGIVAPPATAFRTNSIVGGSSNLSLLVVNSSASHTFEGRIGGNDPFDDNIGLVKAGTGLLVLTGTNTYTGPTTVSNGTLRIQGAHTGSGLITVAGGRLEGTGRVAGALTVLSGGTLAPGASPGQFIANANVTLQSGAIFEVEINGKTPGTLYDQLLMGAGTTLTLSNPTLSVILGFSPAIGDQFQIVSGFSSLSGSFHGLPTSGSTFMAGSTVFKIDYNASDITLTVVPEPSTLGSMGLAIAVLLLRRRFGR